MNVGGGRGLLKYSRCGKVETFCLCVAQIFSCSPRERKKCHVGQAYKSMMREESYWKMSLECVDKLPLLRDSDKVPQVVWKAIDGQSGFCYHELVSLSFSMVNAYR